MQNIRSFIAVEIPDNVKSRLIEAQEALHPLSPFIRWVRAEGIHLTFKFLGNIEQSQVEPISTCIREALKDLRPFRVTASGAGVFPNARYPRVLWVGLAEGQDQLSTIYHRLEERLKALGFKPESRPFRPHLTLGRFKDGRGAGRVLTQEMLERAAPWQESFMVNRVNLMRSQLHPSGAIYTVLKECMLSD